MKTNLTVLALALGIACAQPASTQTFKKVAVAGNAPVAQVASGGTSVWALASNGNHPYIFNGKSFVLANSISLSQIAVGGGNAALSDAGWVLDSSHNVYRASKNGTSWVFTQISGALDLIAVGPGYHDSCHPYEVWGLNTGSQVFRYNYCTGQFDTGFGFLCDIHVGGGDVWGAECGPKVYRFNFGTGSFDPISDPFGAFPVLTVGSNGEVWAADTSNSFVYEYDHHGNNQYQFDGWGCCATQIQAGYGLWILNTNISGNNIERFEPSIGFYGIPGHLISISVGSGGGVWGINSSHQVFAFSTP